MSLKGVSSNQNAAPGPIGSTNPSTGRFTGLQAATVTKTGAYTATANDFTILCNATTAAFSVTLPTAASQPGRLYNVKKIDASANTVTIQCAGAELIDGANTKVIAAQYSNIQFQSDGTAWWIL